MRVKLQLVICHDDGQEVSPQKFEAGSPCPAGLPQ
jgi:hypothetical protein